QREVSGRSPGEHVPAIFPLDPTIVVSGDRDVSAGREIPDDSVHVRGRPFLLRKNEHGGERSCTRRTCPLEVHLELIAGEVGRPDDYLRSRFAGSYELVIRPLTPHGREHDE